MAAAYMVLTNASIARGMLDDGLAYLDRASELLMVTGQRRRQTMIWMLRGQIYVEQRDFERAHHALLEALTVVQHIGLERGAAGLYADLANIEVELKRFKDARQSLYRWITGAQKFGIHSLPQGVVPLSKLAIRENQLEMAAEWISMIQDISSTPLQRLAQPVSDLLTQALDADLLAAAFERGRASSLDADLPRMLRFIQDKLDSISTF